MLWKTIFTNIGSSNEENTSSYTHSRFRFCAECKLKVLEAYDLLLNDPKHRERKGFCPALYQGK